MALLAMFVAHGVPYGPDDLWVLSDFLTAALFAILVGVGAGMTDRPGWSGLSGALVRGSMLVVVGLLLEQTGAQVVVILVHLGVLTWVVALLRPLPSYALAGAAGWLALVAPVLQQSWQDEQQSLLLSGHTVTARVVDVVLTGSSYRLTTLSVWAILGLLAARHLLRGSGAWQAGVGATALVAAAVVWLGLDRAVGVIDLIPYSGSLLEIAFNALLAVGLLLCVVWAARHRPSTLLTQVGQMSLTIYTLHVLWLALLAAVVFDNRLDDSWWTFASLVIGALAVAAAWARLSPGRMPARGPFEAVTDRLVDAVRARAGGNLGRARA